MCADVCYTHFGMHLAIKESVPGEFSMVFKKQHTCVAPGLSGGVVSFYDTGLNCV